MRFLLTESEVAFLKNKFGFAKLLGFNENQRVKWGTKRSLVKKQIICPYNGHFELSASYRDLFSQWEKMRYSFTRPELHGRHRLECVLVSEDACIVFCQKYKRITIDLFAFAPDKRNMLIWDFVALPKLEDAAMRFYCSLSLEDFERFVVCSSPEDFSLWQSKLGVDCGWLQKYLHDIHCNDNARVLLVEDHVDGCGSLVKLVFGTDVICMLQHITYEESEKFVLVMGDSEYIADSFYSK